MLWLKSLTGLFHQMDLLEIAGNLLEQIAQLLQLCDNFVPANQQIKAVHRFNTLVLSWSGS